MIDVIYYALGFFQIKITPKCSKAEEKEDADNNPEKDKLNVESFASLEELEKGKLPLEEILSLPKFKVCIWQ